MLLLQEEHKHLFIMHRRLWQLQYAITKKRQGTCRPTYLHLGENILGRVEEEYMRESQTAKQGL